MNNPTIQSEPKKPAEDLADTKPTAPITTLEDTVVEHTSVPRPALRVAARSDVGAVRTRNEDACLVFAAESGGHSPLEPIGLFIVADGMGGHENGHLASKKASRAAAHFVMEQIYLPILSGKTLEPDFIESEMETAVHAAHTAITQPQPSDSGTTLTMALLIGAQLYLSHVGDSRAYWLVDNKLKAITNDHSLVQRLQDEGRLTAQEAQNYQYRNILLRALGQEDALEVDTYVYTLPSKGKLLMCSDGLCGLVDDARLQQFMRMQLPPHLITENLVEAAMQAGGYDNITAVVVDFSL